MRLPKQERLVVRLVVGLDTFRRNQRVAERVAHHRVVALVCRTMLTLQADRNIAHWSHIDHMPIPHVLATY